MSLIMHTIMMSRLGISPVAGSFETHIFVPYFLILGLVIAAFGDMSRLNLAKLAWYYGSAWAMGLVSLVIWLAELDPVGK